MSCDRRDVDRVRADAPGDRLASTSRSGAARARGRGLDERTSVAAGACRGRRRRCRGWRRRPARCPARCASAAGGAERPPQVRVRCGRHPAALRLETEQPAAGRSGSGSSRRRRRRGPTGTMPVATATAVPRWSRRESGRGPRVAGDAARRRTRCKGRRRTPASSSCRRPPRPPRAAGARPRRRRRPASSWPRRRSVVTQPATSISSLIATGTPCSGPGASPAASARVPGRGLGARLVGQHLGERVQPGSRSPIRARAASTTSRRGHLAPHGPPSADRSSATAERLARSLMTRHSSDHGRRTRASRPRGWRCSR